MPGRRSRDVDTSLYCVGVLFLLFFVFVILSMRAGQQHVARAVHNHTYIVEMVLAHRAIAGEDRVARVDAIRPYVVQRHLHHW